MSNQRLRDIIFTDEKLIDRLVEQIHDLFTDLKKTHIEASISLAGPSVKATKTTERVPLKFHEKIQLIETWLSSNDELNLSRPVVIEEQRSDFKRYIVETMDATKVMLPAASSSMLKGLSQAAIWIADPDPKLFVYEPYDWRGSFLYLPEFHWEHETNWHLSGVSALQLLVNILQGKDFWSIVREEYEPFGRGRDLHPVDKLKDIGAVVIGKRKIRSLYRVRYFTNEQVYNHEGEQRRVNDIFGYPLYISDES